MNFKKTLQDACFCARLTDTTKEGVISEMIDRLVDAGRISDRQAALAAVMEREARGSTGMQSGIAVPHGKTPTVSHIVAAVATRPDGVDFASVDGHPARIFILTLTPPNMPNLHMQFLCEISKVLLSQVTRDAMLAAGTDSELMTATTGNLL